MKNSFSRGPFPISSSASSAVRETSGGSETRNFRKTSRKVGEASFPLSCAQERLWFLDQLVPGSNLYNASWSFRLRGPLQIQALERALAALGRRQEVLCATFGAREGRPTQALALDLPALPQVIDLSSVPAARVEESLAHLVLETSRKPFLLSRGPLLRAVVVRLGRRRSVLVLALHQILADGESGAILLRDLVTLYGATLAGVPAVLPDLPMHYVDIAVRQRRWLESPALPEHLDFWRGRLAGASDTLSLPVDRIAQQGSYRPRRQKLEPVVELPLDGELAPRALVAAAGAAWLARLTGQRDLVLGTMVSLRDERTRDLVGQLSNLLPLRLHLDPEDTFESHSRRTRAVVMEAIEHRLLPFERLAAELMPERALAINPLCRAVISYQPVAPAPTSNAGVSFEPLRSGLLDSGSARYDLALSLWQAEDSHGTGGLEGVAEYNAEALDETTVQRWLKAFGRLLHHALRNPSTALAELPLLSAAELHQLRFEWQGPSESRGRSVETLHQGFERVALAQPEAQAVHGPDAFLTYGELQERAAAVARWLQTLGVRPGDAVGLCMDRSAALVVGVLGVLQAGAICVPLDSAAPPRRLEEGLDAASASAVVTQEVYLDRLPGRLPRLCLDLRRLVAIGHRRGGFPKGVDEAYYLARGGGSERLAVLSHRALLVAAAELAREHGAALSSRDRVAQLFPITFEASLVEIWSALLSGATLEIPREEEVASPGALETFLTSRQVSVLVAQGSWLARLAREVPAALRRLSKLLVVSDTTPPEALARLAGSQVQVMELVGLAETGLLAHRHPPFLPEALPPLSGVRDGSAPRRLGALLSGVRAYVLGPTMEQLPAGVEGELWIGSPHLSTSYPGEARTTARRFLPDPFADAPGSRLLRTGETARRRRDGGLEILDHRLRDVVRIHGQRVDLEVVEAHLGRHPDVRACALVARNGAGDRQLVAFVERETTAGAAGPGAGGHSWRRAYHPHAPDDRAAVGDGGSGALPLEPTVAGAASAVQLQRALRELGVTPGAVLEVGCGEGDLLFPLARRARLYHALDPSPLALHQLHRRLADHPLRPALEDGRLSLLEMGFGDLQGLKSPPGGYDLVVIGPSVTGLPSVDDLRALLEIVLERTASSGVVALMDLPSLPLRPIPHAEAALEQAPDVLSVAALKRQVERSLEREEGLFLDPSLFAHPNALLPKFSGMARVLPRPRRDGVSGDLAFDVLLLPDRSPEVGARIPWVDWRRGDLDLPSLATLLRERKPEALGLTAIPNQRLSHGVRLMEMLEVGEAADALCGSLRQSWREESVVASAVEPEELVSLAEAEGYQADLSLLYSGANGRFDALLRRTAKASPKTLGPPPFPALGPRRDLASLVSDPLTGAAGRRLRERLLAYLETRLPAPMVPEEIVLLPRLPRDAEGHLDRRRLGKGEESVRTSSETPRRPTEALLSTLWAEVLERDEVGVDESFFELGGHSLLATQVVARVRQVFAVDLALAQLFENPTVASLAVVVDELLVRKLEQS
ncbi:MAG: condensation domain-containing protein [Acidobacteriota bacterium]